MRLCLYWNRLKTNAPQDTHACTHVHACVSCDTHVIHILRYTGYTCTCRLSRHICTVGVCFWLDYWPVCYYFTGQWSQSEEASHRSLKVCAEKIRKGLAPHLRTLIGCWVSGMCDPHGPSATAARAVHTELYMYIRNKQSLAWLAVVACPLYTTLYVNTHNNCIHTQ